MSKIRIYELAKQLGVANKDLVAKINSIGIEAKSHMAMLTEEEAAKVTALYQPKKEEPKKDAPKKSEAPHQKPQQPRSPRKPAPQQTAADELPEDAQNELSPDGEGAPRRRRRRGGRRRRKPNGENGAPEQNSGEE